MIQVGRYEAFINTEALRAAPSSSQFTGSTRRISLTAVVWLCPGPSGVAGLLLFLCVVAIASLPNPREKTSLIWPIYSEHIRGGVSCSLMDHRDESPHVVWGERPVYELPA